MTEEKLFSKSPLPWRLSTSEPGAVHDANGTKVLTIGNNGEHDDADVIALAQVLVARMNDSDSDLYNLGFKHARLQAARQQTQAMQIVDLAGIEADILSLGTALGTAGARPRYGVWYPIETAPRDKTPILVALRTRGLFYNQRCSCITQAGGSYSLAIMQHSGAADFGVDSEWRFTCVDGRDSLPDYWIVGWMPLPSPPTQGVTDDHHHSDR